MIFVACLLTVLIETAFFAVFGYRKRYDLTVIVCTNVVTNLLLNLIIQLVFHGNPCGWILPLELAVILSEFLIYAKAFEKTPKILALTFSANCLSYGIGLLIFR